LEKVKKGVDAFMEKEAHRKSKITPFPSMEEREEKGIWEERFQRQLRREADELEEELEAKPELEHIDASPELFDRIVEQLKAEGKWEEETAEEISPDISLLLSEEDREALEIGRRVQRQSKKRRFGKWAGMAGVVLLCVFLVTMSSEANREYAAGVINAITGSRWGIYVEDVDRDTIKYSEEERKAYKEIEEKLGILVPQMLYRPYGMVFKNYQISEERKSGAVFYQYRDSIISVRLYSRMKDTTMQQTLDVQVIDDIPVDILEKTAKLYELEDDDGETYAGEIVYDNCYYVILGKMDKEEMKKILQNIIF